jgi:hypothetical protein
MFDTVISPPPRRDLPLQQVLDLANIYLENACKATDAGIVMLLCHDTEVSLSLAKRAAKHAEDKTMHEEVASVYIGLGDLLENRGYRSEARDFYKKSEKWG